MAGFAKLIAIFKTLKELEYDGLAAKLLNAVLADKALMTKLSVDSPEDGLRIVKTLEELGYNELAGKFATTAWPQGIAEFS